MIKYVSIIGALTLFSTLSTPNAPKINTDDTAAESYILGFDEGSETAINGLNAQICAKHYQRMGEGPGPECHKYYEDFKLGLAKYEKVKTNLTKRQKKNGKSSRRNKKNSN